MSNEPTRAYCIYNLCREKYIGLHEHESETGRITTHAPGRCDRGEHAIHTDGPNWNAASRVVDLALPNVRFRLAQWMCLRHHGWGAHPVNGTRGCSFSEADQLLRSLVAWAAEPGNGDGPPLGVTELIDGTPVPR